MKHYLVTGGAGFIGSRVVGQLLENGDLVTVLDDFSTGVKANVAPHRNLLWIERHLLYTGAEEIPDRLDGIVHLAVIDDETAQSGGPMRQHQANLSATLRLFMLAREKKVPRVVFASSALLDLPQPPNTPYVTQKRAAEEYAQLFCPGCQTLRLPQVTGPGGRKWPIYETWRQKIGSLEVTRVVQTIWNALHGLVLAFCGPEMMALEMIG